jgi:hypothetical protein
MLNLFELYIMKELDLIQPFGQKHYIIIKGIQYYENL